MFKKSILIVLTLVILLAASCSAAQKVNVDEPVSMSPSPAVSTSDNTLTPTPQVTDQTADEQQTKAKYIFYFIGDGMGEAHKQLSQEFLRYASGDNKAKLNLNTMNVNTKVATSSANAVITDSAAASTALATGVKTNNKMIGLSPDGKELTTLLEAVQEKGYSTGIVTTARITHATPAGFYAHTDHRLNEDDIAMDLLDSDIDFVAGGGLCYFLPATIPDSYLILPDDIRGMEIYSERTDAINLVNKFADKGYEMFIGPEGVSDFLEYDPKADDNVFAPLTYNYLPYEIDRVVGRDKFLTLSDMTRQAIRLLSTDEDGFFLMVEGGRIDYAAHNNDALGVIYDTLAFDNAVAVAIDFYAAHPDETLIITTADHETGGLKLLSDSSYSEAFDSVEGIFASFGDGFAPLYHSAQNIEDYLAGIKGFGLEPDNTELAQLTAAYEEALLLDYAEDELNTTASLAVNRILNQRLGVSWTTDYHTSDHVALGVTGVFEEHFSTAEENTDIANILADILDIEIGM